MSRDAPPPLPGGYKAGEKVFFAAAGQTFPSGNKVAHGQQGEVMGPANGKWAGEGVLVLFPGNKYNTNCYLSQVGPAAPAPPPLCQPLPPPHTRKAAHAPGVAPRAAGPRAGEPRCAAASAGRLQGGREGVLRGD